MFIVNDAKDPKAGLQRGRVDLWASPTLGRADIIELRGDRLSGEPDATLLTSLSDNKDKQMADPS